MKIRTPSIYEKRTTSELQTLLSRKKVSLEQLEAIDSFLNRQDQDALRSQIRKIEVELTVRFYQQQLPLE